MSLTLDYSGNSVFYSGMFVEYQFLVWILEFVISESILKYRQKSLEEMNLERLKSMKRHDLQQEAKKYGIKANQASSVLIDLILKQQKVETIFIRYL